MHKYWREREKRKQSLHLKNSFGLVAPSEMPASFSRADDWDVKLRYGIKGVAETFPSTRSQVVELGLISVVMQEQPISICVIIYI